jgi:hypothetical protein
MGGSAGGGRAFFPVAVPDKLSDFRRMMVRRLHGLILALLIGLGLQTVQGMDAAMALPGQPMPLTGAPATDTSCKCCADCEDLAATGTCSVLCVNHPGMTDIFADISVSEVSELALPRVNVWTHLAIPPDLHPPRSSPVI